jgi:hypothetical protein
LQVAARQTVEIIPLVLVGFNVAKDGDNQEKKGPESLLAP